MAEVSVAARLQESGAHALELEGVARHFGALVALAGISMRIAAGERRAVHRLQRRRQDDAVQRHHRRLPADRGPHPLLRRRHHHAAGARADPARAAAHLPDLAAVRRAQRPRFRLSRLPRRFPRPLLAARGRAPTTAP